MSKNLLICVSLAIGMFATVEAGAQDGGVRQPDGVVIPDNSHTDSPTLLQQLVGAGETFFVDPDPMHPRDSYAILQREAVAASETYTPECTITFTVVGRTASHCDSFGWYNVMPGRGPMIPTGGDGITCTSRGDNDCVCTGTLSPTSELHEIVPAGYRGTPAGMPGAVGQHYDVSLRAGAGGYLGGAIGFYLHNRVQGYYYTTERRYQPMWDARAGARNPYYGLYYRSHATMGTYYFVWEDGIAGNDNDFNDVVISVSHLTETTCPDADLGQRCQLPGVMGPCGIGAWQCVGGVHTCVALGHPAETCDGLDNNCDGMIDNGATCPPSRVCQNGACVAPCAGELGCLLNYTCSSPTMGHCIETACMGVTCPAGMVCRMGHCTDPCGGVTCPHGELCVNGVCTNPCAVISCAAGQVCEEGACVSPCGGCRTCGDAGVCDTTSGRCSPSGCAALHCPADTWCSGASCVPRCAGVMCPVGQACVAGSCVPSDGGALTDAAMTDTGAPSDGAQGDIAQSDLSSDGAPGDGSSAGDASTDRGSSADGPREIPANPGDKGCGCRAVGSTHSSSGAMALLALAAVVATRRRRR